MNSTPVFFVVIEIHLVPTGDHPAFPFAHTAHVNGEVLLRDAKLFSNVLRLISVRHPFSE